ncbi:polysaccharide deacetylase family protein [Bacillus sp. MRMR6]|uniref:polysaccharide deacetylase family protein n=1 Tax=Bacillus sp. MRMR6 TaxID=1928617 RepID=UPI0009524184|nr:polysaccharide deacetylase family protein [Bacillus sp. MRMR6]OLS39899.1 polysaccharide deacetylase [Bacillus sp. MRMR6]
MKRIFILIMLVFILPTEAFASQKVPILVYHSIEEYSGKGSKELYVTPVNFEKQMRFLKDHGYTLLTFERWEDLKSVNKPIFITFDDGYKNNLNAFKVLEKIRDDRFQPVATFFVISEFIGRPNRLTEKELKMMSDTNVISIQSHTRTHPDLTQIDNLDNELKVSKEKIEKITGRPVLALAYPYGNFNDRVVQETKKYYKYGLTTTPGPYMKKGLKNELYYLPRIYITYSTTMEDFMKKLE